MASWFMQETGTLEGIVAPGRGAVKRSTLEAFRLLSAFRLEQLDPDSFYGLMAADAVKHIEGFLDISGAKVLDVGGGAGYFSAALKARGALPIVLEPDLGELTWRGRRPLTSVIGDGMELPFPQGVFELVLSSNVLEHVVSPEAFLNECVRVCKVGGVVYCCFTLWYSPWGGHETSPFHYISGDYALRRYRKKYMKEPKNVFGKSLFKVTLSRVLAWLKKRDDVDPVEVAPRYHPWWLKGVIRLPVLNEVLTWNAALILRRTK